MQGTRGAPSPNGSIMNRLGTGQGQPQDEESGLLQQLLMEKMAPPRQPDIYNLNRFRMR